VFVLAVGILLPTSLCHLGPSICFWRLGLAARSSALPCLGIVFASL